MKAIDRLLLVSALVAIAACIRWQYVGWSNPELTQTQVMIEGFWPWGALACVGASWAASRRH